MKLYLRLSPGSWLCITVPGVDDPVGTSAVFKALFPAVCPKANHSASLNLSFCTPPL